MRSVPDTDHVDNRPVSSNTYGQFGCRCPDCKAAKARVMRRSNARARMKRLRGVEPPSRRPGREAVEIAFAQGADVVEVMQRFDLPYRKVKALLDRMAR